MVSGDELFVVSFVFLNLLGFLLLYGFCVGFVFLGCLIYGVGAGLVSVIYIILLSLSSQYPCAQRTAHTPPLCFFA